MNDKTPKKPKVGGALEAGALAEEARGLLTGRTPVSSLIKVIKLLGQKKRYGGSVKKKTKKKTKKKK